LGDAPELLATELPAEPIVRTRNGAPARCRVKHTTCNVQHTTCNVQHTTRNVQHTTRNTHHATHNMQHTPCNVQHTTCNATCNCGPARCQSAAWPIDIYRTGARAVRQRARARERLSGGGVRKRLAPWADSQPGPTRREYRIVYYAACLSPCCMRHCALHVALRQPPACRRHAPRSPASHRHILAADRRVPTTRDSAPLIHSVIQQSTTCGSAVHMHCNANRNTAERELSRSVTVDERKA
jgi:hypothetical protein